jgi:hypothetical protein
VACVRWEEADIAEWVHYHKSIGFSHIYLYSNDADPAPTHKAVLPYLRGRDPFVTFNYFPKSDSQPQQHLIYYHFLETYKQQTEWFTFLDADEFYVLKDVDDVGRFMRPFEAHYDAVYFNWIIYGHAGKEQRDGNSILLSHTQRSRSLDPHTKVLTRSAPVEVAELRRQYEHGKPGFWHFWDGYKVGPSRLVNVLHENMEGYSDAFPKRAYECIRRPGIADQVAAKGYVAHFQFKSEADFQRRVERGGSLTVPFWRDTLARGSHVDFLKRGSDLTDTYLARFWLATAGDAYDIALPDPLTRSGLRNVALRKPSEQSSIRRGVADDPADSHATGFANNGIRTGSFGFATVAEASPWWKLDLLSPFVIREIRIFGQPESALWKTGESAFRVEVSQDAITWRCLVEKPAIELYPETKSPAVIVGTEALTIARFVRISLIGEGSLHCDEVEVYARPA